MKCEGFNQNPKKDSLIFFFFSFDSFQRNGSSFEKLVLYGNRIQTTKSIKITNDDYTETTIVSFGIVYVGCMATADSGTQDDAVTVRVILLTNHTIPKSKLFVKC